MQDFNSLIYDNIGLIIVQLKKFYLTTDPEAESLGYEALYNALKTYDATKRVKFSTYATCCIYNALGSYVRTLNRKRQLDVISYNNLVDTKHEFIDFLTSNIDASQNIMRHELFGKINEAYRLSYNELTNDTRKAIIKAWHDSDYKMFNIDIAISINVSQSYVNQVINIFKFKVRKKLEGYYYD